MAYNKSDRGDSPMKRRGGMRRRKKVCVFCGKDQVLLLYGMRGYKLLRGAEEDYE